MAASANSEHSATNGTAQQNGGDRKSPPAADGHHERTGAAHQLNTLMRSFTEKKLTALMIAICVIFAIGNIPQMVSQFGIMSFIFIRFL